MAFAGPSAPCSSTRRWRIRVTVCRCLRGASRSARKIPSITVLNGSSAVSRSGSFFRGSGQTESTAFVQFGATGQNLLQAGSVFLGQGRGVPGEPAGHLPYRRRRGAAPAGVLRRARCGRGPSGR